LLQHGISRLAGSKHAMGFIAAVALLSPWLAAGTPETIVVRGPTIIAFFAPVTAAELDKDPDTNEALADFQVYAARSRKRFQGSGIDFREIYALSFNIKRGGSTTTFRSGKSGVGYYFVTSNGKPHVEYGVRTDDDLVRIAREHFGIIVK